jgi:signal transduction histidine kinase
LKDISDEKRRRVLERVFFHDVLNTAGGIQGLSEFLLETFGEDLESDQGSIQIIAEASSQLVAEINSQRQLVAAESGELQIDPVSFSTREVMESVRSLMLAHEVAQGKSMEITDGEEVELCSDPTLVKRILINLVKNAFEATAPGGEVSVSCAPAEGGVVFSVHNSAVMSESVKLQIFKRSFSTKSKIGRGIGTYSIKLFAEQYLGGTVNFKSEPEMGTTFRVFLPQMAEQNR